MSRRASFYFDGFNLYHAIDKLGKPHLKWFSLIDYARYVTSHAGEDLTSVQYFSALAHHYPLSVPRHQSYIRALKRTGVECRLGKFKKKPRQCKICGGVYPSHEEKETDVRLGVAMIADAIDRAADVFYLVTTDSDLGPAVEFIATRFPHIELVTVAPPGRRHPGELLALCHRFENLSELMVGKNRLAETYTDSRGRFFCPVEYAVPSP